MSKLFFTAGTKMFLPGKALSLVLQISLIFGMLTPSVGLVAQTVEETDVVLMSLTRTAVNATADAGNQFNADYGIYADAASLTAWTNNEQKVIGYLGTNRTPIVFNNSEAGAWRSVGPADVDAGVTIDTASAFQIKFETTGYESILFSCSQKSTGSGPEFFALAYSIGNPTGPYTAIDDSKKVIYRTGDDTYAALQPSYVNFPLPEELNDQEEVYLRVYMVDSTLSNRSNGNTSINDIVIIGNGTADGEPIVVIPEIPQRPTLDAVSDTGAMTYLGSYWTGETDADGAVAEIVAYNPDNYKMYIVSGKIQALDIVSLAGVAAGEVNSYEIEKRVNIGAIGQAYGFSADDMTSVAVNTRLQVIAVSVQQSGYAENGYIVFLDYDGEYIAHYDAGVQPDMIGFTPDGNYVMTANEGEPRMGYGPGIVDPEGSVTVIDLRGINDHNALANLEAARVATVGFHAFDAPETRAQLVADLVLLKPDTAPSVDLEPEYIAFSEDGRTAYVSLQEANAIATFDIESRTFISIKGLGFKDHGLPGNEIDFNEDRIIDIKTEEGVYGVYMPDGLATVNIGGVQYVLTPNEGDSRSDWPGYDDVRREDVNGAPRVERILNEEREVLKDRPDDIFIMGGRSFSIWNADSGMSLVYDSGSDFERITARLFPDNFNSNHAAANLEGRTARKGPEPEDIKVMQIGSRYYAFIGLERIGGVLMYDITDPANAFYVDYLNVRDFSSSDLRNGSDLGAEGLYVIPAWESPTGQPMVLAANEVSGSVTVIQINDVYVPPTVVSVAPAASVTKLNGNKNDLTITVTERLSDGSVNTVTRKFSIDNNAAGTYTVGDYKVYVDTKGNTQIRECYIVK